MNRVDVQAQTIANKVFPLLIEDDDEEKGEEDQFIKIDDWNSETVISMFKTPALITDQLEIIEDEMISYGIQQKFNDSKSTNLFEMNDSQLERIYSGMISLRRLMRIIILFIFAGLLIGLFVLAYSVTVKKQSWTANQLVSNINVHVGNCFLNISESKNFISFSLNVKGNLKQKVNNSDDFRIKGDCYNQLQLTQPFKILIMILKIAQLIQVYPKAQITSIFHAAQDQLAFQFLDKIYQL